MDKSLRDADPFAVPRRFRTLLPCKYRVARRTTNLVHFQRIIALSTRVDAFREAVVYVHQERGRMNRPSWNRQSRAASTMVVIN